jgi:hypothetical protein
MAVIFFASVVCVGGVVLFASMHWRLSQGTHILKSLIFIVSMTSLDSCFSRLF